MIRRTYKSGESREQASLLPPRIEDYVARDNPVRAIDAYVDALDLNALGFRALGSALRQAQERRRPATLCSGRSVEALPVRLSQPSALVAPAGPSTSSGARRGAMWK